MKRSKISSIPANLVIVDINSFKAIKDVHGNEVDNVVLKLIGAILKD